MLNFQNTLHFTFKILYKCKVIYSLQNILNEMRFVAFPATEYDEVFSGYQLGQMVEQ
jgi:hypothetical protein